MFKSKSTVSVFSHRSIFVVTLMVLFAISAFAQEKVWYKGKVVLADSTVVEGSVNYNLVHQIIRVRNADTEKSYNQSVVNSFQLYDDKMNLLHDFYVVPVNLRGEGHPDISVVEFLYETKEGIALVAHHYVLSAKDRYEQTPVYNGPVSGSMQTAGASMKYVQKFNEQKQSFYSDKPKFLHLVNQEGEFIPFTKKDFFEVFEDRKKELKKYMAANRVYLVNLRGVFPTELIINAMKYYDTLD